MTRFSTLLRLPPGPVDLRSIPTDTSPGFSGSRHDGELALAGLGPELADLQERMWAQRITGSSRRILLVLQGMDTSGKGGTLRHTVGLADPQGVRIHAFKAPTAEERAHDFLWRIELAMPESGYIGVFDRSHYEDVLVHRVRKLTPLAEIERRYLAINAFEAHHVGAGTTIIKCMLHISPGEQKVRLRRRLEHPSKYWKYSPGDLDDRALWGAYRRAYELALERTHTQAAPWHVIPSDKKWYRNLAVGQLLMEALRGMRLEWPPAQFDVEAEKRRLDRDPVIE